MDWILNPESWIAIVTLTALEIVLGIDNIVFISILSGKLPEEKRGKARSMGLFLAMFTRIALLLSLVWVMHLTAPLFTVMGHGFSGRDLILFGGGLFLIAKSTLEIHEKLEGAEGHANPTAAASFLGIIVQIALLDIIFSLDSVITAVGMAKRVEIMIAAIVIAVGFMLVASRAVSAFVERHPTVKMLALSFLFLIGVSLMGEGLHFHIPKGYIYSAMAFSVCVEMLNIRLRRTLAEPVRLRDPITENRQAGSPMNRPT
ncbi:MAG: TerC family protein [Deltaproteobacteria bacterium]